MERDKIIVRMLDGSDAQVLERIAGDVFDGPLKPALVREFLADPRHHLAVAMDGELVVGMASGVHYVHPDKPAQLFINEVGVASTHQRQGLGRRLLEVLLGHGRELGCVEAWVATDVDNESARGLYSAAGGVEQSTPCVVYSFRLDQR